MKSLRQLTSLSLFSLATFALSTTVAFAGPPPPPPSGGPPPPAEGTPPPPSDGAVPPPSGGAVPPAGGPLNTAPPTGKLSGAEDAYKANKFEQAAMEFAEAAGQQIPGDTPRAQFWLGKSLYKLGFFASSLSVFGEIVAAGPTHPYHKLTLPWLASLGRELPEGAGVLEKIGSYKPESLEDEAFNEVRDELYYYLGRFFYQKGDLGQAITLLRQVPDDSDYYIPAQFFLGVGETREYHGKEAVEAFKEVLRKNIALQKKAEKEKKKRKKEAKARKKELKKLKKKNPDIVIDKEFVTFEEEMKRFEERANLALGYIFYQVGKFETANKYFDKLPQDSPYWLDSIFASAWSEFRMVEAEPEEANIHYQRTLGYIHTLNAPFFYDYLYPEAVILKAVAYYFNCRYDPAKTAIDEFNRRYPKTRDDLRNVLAQAPEDFALFELSVKIRAGESSLDAFVEEVAQKSLQDKTLEKNYQFVNELEREAALLEQMSGSFKSSAAGDRITDDLDGLTSLAKEATGALARVRLQSQIKEITDLEREAIKIEYEILNRLKAGESGQPPNRRPSKPKIDSEHEIYNYNGEYWKDELGFYNYKVTSLCKEE